jgi:hypothetical protein
MMAWKTGVEESIPLGKTYPHPRPSSHQALVRSPFQSRNEPEQRVSEAIQAAGIIIADGVGDCIELLEGDAGLEVLEEASG